MAVMQEMMTTSREALGAAPMDSSYAVDACLLFAADACLLFWRAMFLSQHISYPGMREKSIASHALPCERITLPLTRVRTRDTMKCR